ncbi:hypothetical protein IL306_012804 [Fusarium sp. DS 682]|nr:hypothetical protein IL306_012804 [Fusarium sp. DS 682]
MIAVPSEIWHQIFAELEDHMPLEKWHMYGAQLDHQGASALRNLCLVCRQFRRLAQPLLYRTILIEGRNGVKDIGTLLLRTILENPQLAEQIRAVSLTDNVLRWAHADILRKDGSEGIVLSALMKLDVPPALRKRIWELSTYCGFAALLLAYMPHVRFVDCTADDPRTPLPWLLSTNLDIKEGFHGYPQSWSSSFVDEGDYDYGDSEDEDIQDQEADQGISKTTFANFSFPNLTEVRIRTVDNENYTQSAEMIEPLLLNPTLKILRTFGTAWFGHTLAELESLEDKNYNLEYFDLMETFIDAEGLMTILERCPKLKGVSIDLPDDFRERPMEHEDDNFILNYHDYGTVLREHGQNLEEFNLHTFHFEESYSRPGEGRIGSLRELKSLRHLKLSKDSLIGIPGSEQPPLRLSEVLPESIETLFLYWDGDCLIHNWFGSRRDVYNQEVCTLLLDGMPNLREIRMERKDDWYDDSDDDSDEGSEGYDDDSEDDYHHSEEEDDDSEKDGGSEGAWDSNEDEWPDELHVDGWDVDITKALLWKIRGRPANKRKIVTLTRKK